MYDVIHLNIGKSRANLVCVYINIFRSEEHTSELQSPCNLVCRLLLEKKKKKTIFDDDTPRENFLSVMQVVEINNRAADAARPGYCNHAEMLVTDNRFRTLDRQKAHVC